MLPASSWQACPGRGWGSAHPPPSCSKSHLEKQVSVRQEIQESFHSHKSIAEKSHKSIFIDSHKGASFTRSYQSCPRRQIVYPCFRQRVANGKTSSSEIRLFHCHNNFFPSGCRMTHKCRNLGKKWRVWVLVVGRRE